MPRFILAVVIAVINPGIHLYRQFLSMLVCKYFDNVTLEFSERSCEISDFNSRISRLFFVGSPLNTNLMIAHQLSSLRQSVYGMKIYLTSVYAGF